MINHLTPELLAQLAVFARNEELPGFMRKCASDMLDLSKKQLEAQRFAEDFFVSNSAVVGGSIEQLKLMVEGFTKLQELQSDLVFLSGRCILSWKKWKEEAEAGRT